MKEDLSRLIALQEIDLQIKKLDDGLANGHAEIIKRQASIAEKKEKIIKHRSTIENAENRRKELETEIESEVAHIKDRQSKLMNVQTNREYQSLLKEIEEAKKSNKRREEEIVLLMEQVESLQKKVEEQGNVCNSEEKLLTEAEEKIALLSQETQEKKGKLEKTREQQVKKIPENLRRRYDQLLDKRNGLAITGVINGVCQGCFMNIPAQQFNEVLKGEQLLFCPTCQRMMFHQTPAKED
ncbi:MAG: C4-type zinc ribbon domain-containing protein [Desulfobulbaceae bacterium]|nr:C4-type zinc ribbon domain-containing protein [Desulfobulbaceae bacterium]